MLCLFQLVVSAVSRAYLWARICICGPPPHLKEPGFWNQGNFCLWNPEFLGFEIGNTTQGSGIPLTTGIQNPSATDKDWNPVPAIQNRRMPWIPTGVTGITPTRTVFFLSQKCITALTEMTDIGFSFFDFSLDCVNPPRFPLYSGSVCYNGS